MLRTHPVSCAFLRRVRIITGTVMSAAIHQMSGGHPFRISSASTVTVVIPATILAVSLILDWLVVCLTMACIFVRLPVHALVVASSAFSIPQLLSMSNSCQCRFSGWDAVVVFSSSGIYPDGEENGRWICDCCVFAQNGGGPIASLSGTPA